MHQNRPTQAESSYARPNLNLESLKRPLPGAHQIVLDLADTQLQGHPRDVKPGTSNYWTIMPSQRFLPLGVLFWGAAPETRVTAIFTGNVHGGVEHEGVPARYFETGRSLAEIEKLAAVGELGGALPDRLLLRLTTCEYGSQVGVRVVGPFEGCCMWGLVPDGQYHQVLDTRIWLDEASKQHRAEVVGLDINGPILKFAATAASESVALELVKSYLAISH